MGYSLLRGRGWSFWVGTIFLHCNLAQVYLHSNSVQIREFVRNSYASGKFKHSHYIIRKLLDSTLNILPAFIHQWEIQTFLHRTFVLLGCLHKMWHNTVLVSVAVIYFDLNQCFLTVAWGQVVVHCGPQDIPYVRHVQRVDRGTIFSRSHKPIRKLYVKSM
jgi:hypothetical protein